MNVLLYNLENYLTELITQLQKISDISIFFAVTKNDIQKLANEVKIHLLFVGELEPIEEKIIKKFILTNPELKIYYLDNLNQIVDLNFRSFQSKKNVKFNNVIAEIRAN